jgi:hypothetical protein
MIILNATKVLPAVTAPKLAATFLSAVTHPVSNGSAVGALDLDVLNHNTLFLAPFSNVPHF